MMRSMRNRDRTLAAFGRNVARIRGQRGFSQDKLAEQADLDRTFVSGIERADSATLESRRFCALPAPSAWAWTNSARGWTREPEKSRTICAS